MVRVINGGPWTNILLLKHIIYDGLKNRIPEKADFWIQILNLLYDMKSKKVEQNIGNFIREFIDVDQTNFSGSWKPYSRIRVKLNVKLPLRRRMKIKKGG